MNIQAVIFDMDGLMLDTENISKIVWVKAAEDYEIELDEQFYRSLIGLNSKDGMEKVKNHFGADFPLNKFLDHVQRLYMERIKEKGIPVKPGLFELLDFLKNSTIKTSVATSTGRKTAEKKLKMTNLISRFDYIIAGDEVKNGKPSPDIFLKAAAKLNTAPENCMVLEDSFNGITGAHAASMIPVMIPDLLEPDEKIRSLAYAVLPSLFEVQDLISNFLRGNQT